MQIVTLNVEVYPHLLGLDNSNFKYFKLHTMTNYQHNVPIEFLKGSKHSQVYQKMLWYT